ncbi:MAG: dodecin [Kiloniellaceae bacterium]
MAAKESTMSDHVYSVTEVYGSSADSLDGAIRNAVSTASKSLRNLEWFEVSEIRGHIADGAVAHFQVGVKLGFRYDK